MKIRHLLVVVAAGTAAYGAVTSWEAARSVADDEAYTREVEARAERGVKPDDPEKLLAGPERTGIQRHSQDAAGILYGSKEKREGLLNVRQKITVEFVFRTGSSEYDRVMEEIAWTDDKSLFDVFVENLGKYDDGRFDEMLKERIAGDDFHFSRFNGTEMSPRTRNYADGHKIDTVRNAIKAVGKRHQKFAIEQAIRYHNMPGFDSWDTYPELIGRIGGDAAIEYLIDHFSERGLKNSGPLANAVRTRNQAHRVYGFIWDQMDAWKGSCKEVVYATADLKKIGEKFGVGMPPDPYCP